MLLLVPVVVASTSLALSAARQVGTAADLVGAEEALESAVAVFEAELAALSPGDGILAISPAMVRYRARRGAGRWCWVDTTGVMVPVGAGWAASRQPVAGRDSAVVFLPDTSQASGGRPFRVGIVAAPTAAACPAGAPATWIPSPGIPVSTVLHDLLQTEEVVELSSYLSGGQQWLGLRHVGLGGAVEPVAGPFDPGSIVFEGLDAMGIATAIPMQVRAIRIRLGSVVPAVGSRTWLAWLRG